MKEKCSIQFLPATVSDKYHPFHITDQSGRFIGVQIGVATVIFSPSEEGEYEMVPGEYCAWRIQTTRNRRTWGAVVKWKFSTDGHVRYTELKREFKKRYRLAKTQYSK